MADKNRAKWAKDRKKRYKPKVTKEEGGRERNVGIKEEHSKVPKGSGRTGGKRKYK